MLALRGDPPQGETEWIAHPEGLHYSVELIELIKAEYDFCVGAACFPEVHPDAPNAEEDLKYLKSKVDAGASFLITQLFFDNADYFSFVDEARAAGIDVPIIPGICRHRLPADQANRRPLQVALPGRARRASSRSARTTRTRSPISELHTRPLQSIELLAKGAPGSTSTR